MLATFALRQSHRSVCNCCYIISAVLRVFREESTCRVRCIGQCRFSSSICTCSKGASQYAEICHEFMTSQQTHSSVT